MRLLFISSTDYPYPLDRGARYHIHYWLKALSADHDVDFLLVEPFSERPDRVSRFPSVRLVSLGETPNCALPRRLMRKVWSVLSGITTGALLATPKGAVEYVQQAVMDRRYDLAILWSTDPAGYVPMLQGSVPTILIKLSVDATNSRDQRKRASMWHPRWAIEELVAQRFEGKTCRAVTTVCTVNREDAWELARRYQLTNLVKAIPIGVELGEFARRERVPNSKIIGFVGNLSWCANMDAVKWLAQEIAPKVLAAHPEARFRVIGPGGEALREKYSGPRFEFTGYVASVRDALADVAVGVVPVLSGTGMRLKLLELLSVGIPTVTTSLGAAGLSCVTGEDALIADGTAPFAGAVDALLSDAGLRAKLSQRGPELAQQYSWDCIEARVRELVNNTMVAASKILPVKAEPSRASSASFGGGLRLS